MVATPYKPLLGELLVELGVVTRAQLARALAEQLSEQERLGETLVRLGLVRMAQITAALDEQRRRWYAAAFGAAMMVIQPAALAARAASSQMRVSVQVDNATTTNVTTAGGGLSLACAQPMLARVTTGQVRIQQPTGAVQAEASPYIAAAPSYTMTVTPMSQQEVACEPGATSVSIAVSLTPSKAGSSISVQFAY